MSDSGPMAEYQRKIDLGELRADPAQYEAMANLQRLFDDLLAPAAKPGFLSKMFGSPSVGSNTRQISGLYFWGGVGRGKTFLMDVFYDALPFEQKQRMHFHRFMRHVHKELHELQGQSDPLEKIASRFASRTKVLCFDEFFVSDITDAMILSGLLDAMFRRGLVLVATSNVEPKRLYENGLQRSKFLPAIALIEAHTQILNVDGGVDYRLRALESAEIYHYPLDAGADEGLQRSFASLSPDAGSADVGLEIEGRIIQARMAGDGVVWFDFPEICDGPRSQNDYIELAMLFQTVMVGRVPQFTSQTENAARRFISLVDEFYDHNVKLILSAEVAIVDLYAGERLQFEFQRTVSRLQEMQSHEYLSQEHLP
jgi:cell division protein ZapE